MKNRFVNITLNIVGSAILSFGLFNIHSLSGVTEGGILGLTLFLKHWLNISPALSGFVLNAICYYIGYRILGKSFVFYSLISGIGFSVFYAVFEFIGPVFNQISSMPLLASVLGALFVGVGVGLCVRAGGAPSGDDALAMGLSEVFKCDIRTIYLITDLTVLMLSMSYIGVSKIIYSLISVILSGQVIGIVQKISK